jgi:preprotein translocase subunit SecA
VRAFQLAIEARALYLRDRDYLVRDGRIFPIDRRTGRAGAGQFRGGLAIALAAKEGLPLPDEEIVQAETTIPTLVASYPLVSGMSGSAAAATEELGNAYGLTVERVAPHRPCIRVDAEDRLFADRDQALAAAVEAVRTAHEAGRPVLLGTIDVSAAERAAAALAAAGLSHELLTARDHEHEAAILADAGAPGAITVSAAIAGRGVDILLGGRSDHPEADARREQVVAAGGLAIIGLGRHDERRLDEQLKGRAGRAGDPGSSVFYLSADDHLFRAVGAERLRKLLDRLGHGKRALYGRAINRAVESAQTRLGGLSIDARTTLRHADEPFARQRALIAAERARLVDGADPIPTVRDAIEIAAHDAISAATSSPHPREWDMRAITGALLRIGVREDEVRVAAEGVEIRERDDLVAAIDPLLEQVLTRRLAELGVYAGLTLRVAVLVAIDRIYEEHLAVIGDLRTARALRVHGAGRAATSYALDVAKLYDEYRHHLAREIARTALHLTPSRRDA